jgi:hypothetical protein
MDYNLLDEKWIPVLYRDGRYQRVGIRKALVEAGQIRQIAASNPMDNVALLRFLLAVLLWCKDDAKSALAALSDRSIGIHEGWLAKLDDNKTAFNLLGDDARFYQDASLKNKEARPIADLLVEFPGADSVNHMRYVIHGSYGFCPACCALGVLRLSVWAPANRYYPASVNPGTAAYIIAEMENLLLTLVANLPEAIAQANQAPWLSNTPPDSPGAVAYLAWRPRKLWLNIASKQGSCANCGRSGILVASLCNEGGWPTPTTDGQKFAKAVEAEFKKLGYSAKGKDQASRNVKKVVKNASLIRLCRMDKLRKACNAGNSPLTAAAQPPETDEHGMARMFHELILKNDEKAIKALTQNATADEQSQLGDGDTKTKKFWDTDPHMLRDGEAISLPGLSLDAAAHSSKFWRAALRLRGARTGKVIAIGPVVNKFTFQDATSVGVPNAATQTRAKLTDVGSNKLRDLLKQATPNPDRQHPEINAALVTLIPDTEARIRATLNEMDATADDTKFLHEIYGPLVERVVTSTTCGSPLRRREVMRLTESALEQALRKIASNQKQASSTNDNSQANEAKAAKPKRRRKKRETGT